MIIVDPSTKVERKNMNSLQKKITVLDHWPVIKSSDFAAKHANFGEKNVQVPISSINQSPCASSSGQVPVGSISRVSFYL